MTQTVSSKSRLRQCLTTFKWELRNCSGALLVFAILAGVFTTVIFTICLVVGFSEATDSWSTANAASIDYDAVKTAVKVFQIIASYVVFFLNAVFTIIYTIRIYSYLHNKRKADMYGALPISRRTFYVAKTVSAYIFSLVPTMFFLSMIALISVCFGQPLVNEVTSLYLNLLLGSIACVSFYGLLAVCCGTTVNSVIAFIAINFAYVVAAMFIKGTVMSFLHGMPLMIYENSFIMKALNPLSAYSGGNIIYWIIFTAACLALGIFLVKKRRAECAQTSFAYWLPAYMVKVLVAFDFGMFLGSIFGALGVFFIPFAGFMFGFVLGSVPAYVITHMILYRGVNKLIKTAIPLGGLVVLTAGVMFVLSFDITGYNRFVPVTENIKSAGVIDLEDCYFTGKLNAVQLGNLAADDYTDADDIRSITYFHHGIVGRLDSTSYNPYADIWANMFLSGFSSSLYNKGYVVSYKLNNGFTVTRCYYEQYGTFSDFTIDETNINDLLDDEEYFLRYSSIMNAKYDEINSLSVSDDDNDWGSYYLYSPLTIQEDEYNPSAKADIEKVMTAYRKDFAEHGEVEPKDAVVCINIRYRKNDNLEGNSFLGEMLSLMTHGDSDGDRGYVSEDYTRTLKAMREIGVLDKDNKLNKTSWYYQNPYR